MSDGSSVTAASNDDDSWLTFLSHRSGSNLLYRMRPDGGELTPIFGGVLKDVPGLSEGQCLYRKPHWTRLSPDRKFFLSWAEDVSSPSETNPAPRSHFVIQLGRIDGGPTRVLAPDRPGEVFTWAPDSRRFAYSRFPGPDTRTVTGLSPRIASTQVVIVDVKGLWEEVILEKSGYWTASDWSPDGQRLLLLYEPTRSPRFGRSDVIELDLVKARDRKQRMNELRPGEDFASGRAVERCLRSLTDGQPIGWFTDARLSPDGTRIAVVFSRRTQLNDPGFHELGVFDLASETLLPIANYPDPDRIVGPICWSPDGTEILLARSLEAGDPRESLATSDAQRPGIWAIRPDGTGERFITTGWCPDWR